MTAPVFRPSTQEALKDLYRRVKALEAVQAARFAGGGGSGLQFNAGTYGPTNTGDTLLVETTASLSSDIGGDFGVIFQNVYGMLVEGADPNQGPSLWADSSNTADSQSGANALTALADDGGFAHVEPLGADIGAFVFGTGSNATGASIGGNSNGPGSAVGTHTTAEIGISGAANTTFARALTTHATAGSATGSAVTGEAVGADLVAEGRATSSGDIIGLRVKCLQAGSGDVVPVRVLDHTGTPIFEIYDNGEIFPHLPTSPGTSGSLYSNLGIVTVSP